MRERARRWLPRWQGRILQPVEARGPLVCRLHGTVCVHASSLHTQVETKSWRGAEGGTRGVFAQTCGR